MANLHSLHMLYASLNTSKFIYISTIEYRAYINLYWITGTIIW